MIVFTLMRESRAKIYAHGVGDILASNAVKLIKLRIKNFRSLKKLELDLEEYLSIIVGKNNSGKTSLLLALERFLSANPHLDLDDFNTDFQKYLVDLAQNKVQPPDPYPFCGIALRLFIEYSEDDDLANVGNKVIMDLDPENRTITFPQKTSRSCGVITRRIRTGRRKKPKTHSVSFARSMAVISSWPAEAFNSIT